MSADVQFSAQNQKKRSPRPIFRPNQVKTKKKGHHVPRPSFVLKLPNIFRRRMIQRVFTVHNAGKEGIFWRPRLQYKFFLLKRRTYGKPTRAANLNLLELNRFCRTRIRKTNFFELEIKTIKFEFTN